MKFPYLAIVIFALHFNAVSFAKENRKPAASCTFANIQEEIYIVFHDANRRVLHNSLTPEDQVTFGSLGVNHSLAGRLVDKISDICGDGSVVAADFAADRTLITVYKKLGVYNP